MTKKRKIFSICLAIVAVSASLLHGSFMASAYVGLSSNLHVAENNIIADGIYGSIAHGAGMDAEKIAKASTTDNSLMPCCLEDFSDDKYQKFVGSRKMELLKLLASSFMFAEALAEKRQPAESAFTVTNLPPPEETILDSVIRLE